MALLVGNARYAQAALANPVNDVRLVGTTLRQLGFSVTILEDADKSTFHGAVIDFCTRLEQAGSNAVAFFYYAGHGIQHDGTNYLLPVKADIPSSRHLAVGALRVDEIVAELARMPRKANVIVLDACRNNPLPNMVAASRDVTQGLAALRLPAEGMLVVYSTAAGEVAEDGDGSRSPYASALVEALPGLLERGRRIHDVFVEAADRVRQATAGKQKPALYMHGSLPALLVISPELVAASEADAGSLEAVVPTPVPPRRRRWRLWLARASGLAAAAAALVVAMSWLGWGQPVAVLGQLVGAVTGAQRDSLPSVMASEFPATATPYGYRFEFVEGFCCIGEKEERLGIEGHSRVYFVRDDLPWLAPKGQLNDTWEGFNYFYFIDARHAARFTLADLNSLELMKFMLGADEAVATRFDERAWRGNMTISVPSTSGPAQELPCYIADTLIGCLVRSSNPRIVYQLLLQEPKLRTARTDEARQNLVKARVQKEGGLLMRAAEEHIKWAERVAGR